MKTPILQRLMSKISPEPMSGCWLWTGATDRHGYGRIWSGFKTSAGNKQTWIVPRVSYEQHVGPIPDGMVVRHKCDNPYCAAPHHLELGTMKENTKDMMDRGRDRFRADLAARENCINGHPFSGENLYFVNGVRRCRKCAVIRTMKSKAKAQAARINPRKPTK